VPAIAAGSSATVFVTWTPVVSLTPAQIEQIHFAFHSCIQVSVSPVTGEIVTTNNSAQENIQNFEAVATGIAGGGNFNFPVVNRSFNLTNSIAGNSQQFTLRAGASLPPGWTFSVNGGMGTLQLFSGQTLSIPVVIMPTPSPAGQIYHLRADAVTIALLSDHGSSHDSWFIEGGVDLGVHTVLPSQITVSATESNPNNPPTTVHVTGTLKPLAAAGSIVTIDVYDTANHVLSSQVTVQSDGSFTDTMTPSFIPSSVRAIWQGDMLYASAVASAPITVLAVPSP
jgi:hypothetical protein